MTDRIKIIIADDHQLFRSGIISLLSDVNEILVIGEAEDGVELVEKYFKLKPDVMLVDISMPQLSGTSALIKIRKKDEAAKALFLSMYDGEEYVYYCLKAGGAGLINKNIMKGELIYAIKEIYSGRKYFSKLNEKDLSEIVEEYESIANPKIALANVDLSQREEEVLRLIGEGLTSIEISEKLFISKRTVDTHRASLIQKLNLKSFPDLIKYAIKFSITKST